MGLACKVGARRRETGVGAKIHQNFMPDKERP